MRGSSIAVGRSSSGGGGSNKKNGGGSLLLGRTSASKTTTTKNWLVMLLPGTLCLACMSLLPIFLLETTVPSSTAAAGGGVDAPGGNTAKKSMANPVHDMVREAHHVTHHHHHAAAAAQRRTTQQQKDNAAAAAAANTNEKTRTTKDGRVLMNVFPEELPPDDEFQNKPVARGIAGRPLEQTPALQGVSRAHIECDVNIDSLAYWNDPYASNGRDESFVSPFITTPDEAGRPKYISFSSDRGGWNNVRMSLEILFVIAAATGRTLVLPPKEPLYLMHHDKANRYRGFADFFPIHEASFQKRVSVITFDEFLKREMNDRLPIPDDLDKDAVLNAADHCDKRKKSSAACTHVNEYLAKVATVLPEMSAHETCLIFDQHQYETGHEPDPAVQEHIHTVCGDKRNVQYWDKKELDDAVLIHFRAGEKQYRLLTHFYGMIHFTDAAIDNYFKRFVRDYLHYHHSIYCAAGKIVKAVQAEGVARGFTVDENGAGAFSALHVRRGDLQYKKVKIPAQEWYDNTAEVWQPKEILYVATDERDKSFFDDLAAHHDLRFLDDYWEMAGLGDLDPNYMGMIDTIVASRGRAFAGTWFSTFSGYINRLRGYHGLSMMDSWYSFLPKKTAVHEWHEVGDFAYAYEWPDGWIGIDADVWPERDKF